MLLMCLNCLYYVGKNALEMNTGTTTENEINVWSECRDTGVYAQKNVTV